MPGQWWVCIDQGYLLVRDVVAVPMPMVSEFPAWAWASLAVATGSQVEERHLTPSSCKRLPSCPGGLTWSGCYPEVGFTQGKGKLSEGSEVLTEFRTRHPKTGCSAAVILSTRGHLEKSNIGREFLKLPLSA